MAILSIVDCYIFDKLLFISFTCCSESSNKTDYSVEQVICQLLLVSSSFPFLYSTQQSTDVLLHVKVTIIKHDINEKNT